jgi:hypothetical protein
MERLCLEQAEEAGTPEGRAGLLSLAANYRAAAALAVARTVAFDLAMRKRRVISRELTGHPFRQIATSGPDTRVTERT